MQITQNSNGDYEVLSDSGKQYDVTLKTKLDEMGSMYFVWKCTCQAFKFRSGECKHILAVKNLRWDEAKSAEDYDGMDVMEREA